MKNKDIKQSLEDLKLSTDIEPSIIGYNNLGNINL